MALALGSVFFSPVTFAGECFSQPVVAQNWYGKLKSAANIRDVACMEGSNVVATFGAGTVVRVLNNDDGWLEVETNGQRGWVWYEFIEATARPAGDEEVVREPLYDVEGHRYEEAVRFVNSEGIVQGYPDNSYQPDRTLQRDELLKIVVEAAYDDEFENYDNNKCFSDIDPTQWYAKYVCFAKEEGIVVGYEDNTFRPTSKINLVEALKIALIGFDYDVDELGGTWYRNYVLAASERNFLPLDFRGFNEQMSRAQMAEMITRMLKYSDRTQREYLGDDADRVVTYMTLEAGANPTSTSDLMYLVEPELVTFDLGEYRVSNGVVYFGPMEMVPEAAKDEYQHVYMMELLESRSLEDISAEDYEFTSEPEQITINGLDVVTYETTGLCSYVNYEVLLETQNVLFRNACFRPEAAKAKFIEIISEATFG